MYRNCNALVGVGGWQGQAVFMKLWLGDVHGVGPRYRNQFLDAARVS